MKDINTCIFTGRLTKDAELKNTQSGAAITRFSIANNYTKKNGDKYEDFANFFDCVIIGKYGEKMKSYLLKGVQITVMAEARQQNWGDEQGNKKTKIEFIVSELNLKSEKKSNTHPESCYTDNTSEAKISSNSNVGSQPIKSDTEIAQAFEEEFGGDIPFNR